MEWADNQCRAAFESRSSIWGREQSCRTPACSRRRSWRSSLRPGRCHRRSAVRASGPCCTCSRSRRWRNPERPPRPAAAPQAAAPCPARTAAARSADATGVVWDPVARVAGTEWDLSGKQVQLQCCIVQQRAITCSPGPAYHGAALQRTFCINSEADASSSTACCDSALCCPALVCRTCAAGTGPSAAASALTEASVCSLRKGCTGCWSLAG